MIDNQRKSLNLHERRRQLSDFARKITTIIIAGLVISGCTPARQAYEQAYLSKNPQKMEHFIKNHPDSDFIMPAKNTLAKWLMEKHQSDTRMETFRDLIARYPDNKSLYQLAQKRMSYLSFEEASQKNTLEAYQSFITQYPFSAEKPIALGRMDDLRFRETKAKNDLSAYQAYLKTNPPEYNRKQIVAKMAEIEFKKAEASNNSEDYAEFLKKYPDSPLAVKATEKLLNLKLPSSFYDSSKGAVLIHWGKIGMIRANKLKAVYGEEQAQEFTLSKNIRICDQQGNTVPLNRLQKDNVITLASFPERNHGEVVAIYLGQTETQLTDRQNLFAPGTAHIRKVPTCFPAQVTSR